MPSPEMMLVPRAVEVLLLAGISTGCLAVLSAFGGYFVVFHGYRVPRWFDDVPLYFLTLMGIFLGLAWGYSLWCCA